MLNIKGVFLLLPLLACFGSAADLNEYLLNQQCAGKSMDIIAYPGEDSKFIICVNEKAQVGACRSEPDPSDATKQLQTCFDERKQSCNLNFCPSNQAETNYEQFVKEYCKDEDNWLTHVPAEDCESYFVCFGSVTGAVKYTCPEGMHFSRVTKSCQPQLVAGCQNLDSMCKDKPTSFRFASTNCYDYYECRLGKPTVRSCPYGKHFEPNTKKCVSMQSSKCVEEQVRLPKCTTDNNGMYFKHPKCDRFYVCVNSVALEAQCPLDFFFDEKNQMCRKDNAGVCNTSDL